MTFATIVADPPWTYTEGFAQQSATPGVWFGDVINKKLPYKSMSVDEIKSLPVRSLAATDNASVGQAGVMNV